jgi:hypothetical protein
MKLHFATMLAAMLALAGCVQTASIDTAFNNSEHDYALKAGTATVNGQAFLRRRDGMVVYGAGGQVLLVPWTSYTQEMSQKASKAAFGVNFNNLDGRLAQYVKRTQADGEGRFTFNNVPDGNYVVSAMVTWMAGDASQGGEVRQHVSISNGQSANVILTR